MVAGDEKGLEVEVDDGECMDGLGRMPVDRGDQTTIGARASCGDNPVTSRFPFFCDFDHVTQLLYLSVYHGGVAGNL